MSEVSVGGVEERRGPSESADSGAQYAESLTADDVIATLDLSPHPEGGHFRETYRSEQRVSTDHGSRAASTATLYLLTQAEPSRFHRLRSDELWFYHAGTLTELLLLRPVDRSRPVDQKTGAGLPEHRVVGPGSPYVLVPAGWWMAARTIVGDQTDWGVGRAPERRWTADRRSANSLDWTLVSCVVTPGFEYEDLEMGEREALLQAYPLAQEVIRSLT